MGTIVEFLLLVQDSLKYRSKVKSPINRSAKAVISRNLTTSRHNHLLINFVLFFFSFFFFFLFFSYIYRKQALPSYPHSDSNRCYWLAWMNKNIYLLLRRLNLSILAYFDKHYEKSEWCLLKSFRIELFIFPMDTPCLLIRQQLV